MRSLSFVALLVLSLISGCKNRDVNPVDLSTREMHESIKSDQFDRIEVDGVTYLIMERDRNNPHEGFGFMALSGKGIVKKQDSILAYQKLILQNQVRILSRMEGLPRESINSEMDARLQELIKK